MARVFHGFEVKEKIGSGGMSTVYRGVHTTLGYPVAIKTLHHELVLDQSFVDRFKAQASKAPIQCTADRIVPWFVAATLSLGLLTFLIWVRMDFEVALMAATAVLIITCPCAFGMATPMAIAVASGLGARHGILVKTGAVLESLSSIDHFVFDKTGTLTEGRPVVTDVYAEAIGEDELLAVAAEQGLRASSAEGVVAGVENALGKAVGATVLLFGSHYVAGEYFANMEKNASSQ